MAKKKANKVQKAQYREARLRRAKQWLITYQDQGMPKQMVKQYKKRFHLDTICIG